MSMKVLCVKEDTSLNVFEVVDVWYSDNIIGVGKASPYKPIEGILMTATSSIGTNYTMYIENISMERCNEICESLYLNGVADLREYGPYQVRQY